MAKDPTIEICEFAESLPDVDPGTACTQRSFKVNKKAFLFIGPQGGRFKAMFKLDKSMDQAEELAANDPDHFEVGKTGWVTARFSSDKPIGKRIWKKWIKESYELCSTSTKKKTTKTKRGKAKSDIKPRSKRVKKS